MLLALCANNLYGGARRARMSAVDVVKLQLDALLQGDTSVAYMLASPSNRRRTAGGGYNQEVFANMVNRSFSPMLAADSYETFFTRRKKGVVVALLYAKRRLLAGYEFVLSRQQSEDAHWSLGEYRLPRHSGFWRTDEVRLLSTFECRQLQFRRMCFGKAWDSSRVQHSFGVDATHNLCCQLGPKARKMSDREGNLRGDPSGTIPGDEGFTRWPTCMGSNVCGDYADRARDGTRPVFATNKRLTQVAIDIGPTRDCDTMAAQLLEVPRHATPGIDTRGDPSRCVPIPRILRTPAQIDAWIASQRGPTVADANGPRGR